MLNPEVAPASTTAQVQSKKKASPPASATLKKKEEKPLAVDKKKKSSSTAAPAKGPAKMTRQQKMKADQIVKEERDKEDKLMKDEAAAEVVKEDEDMVCDEKLVDNAPDAPREENDVMEEAQEGYDDEVEEDSEDEVEEEVEVEATSSISDEGSGTEGMNALDREVRRKRKAAFKKEQ